MTEQIGKQDDVCWSYHWTCNKHPQVNYSQIHKVKQNEVGTGLTIRKTTPQKMQYCCGEYPGLEITPRRKKVHTLPHATPTCYKKKLQKKILGTRLFFTCSARTALLARSTDARRPHSVSAARTRPATASAVASLFPAERNTAASRAENPFRARSRLRPTVPLSSRNASSRCLSALRRRAANPLYILPDAQARRAAASKQRRAAANAAAPRQRCRDAVATARALWARAARPASSPACLATLLVRAAATHAAKPRDSARKRRRPESAVRWRTRRERRTAAVVLHLVRARRCGYVEKWARARASAIPSLANDFQCATTFSARCLRRRRLSRCCWAAAAASWGVKCKTRFM